MPPRYRRARRPPGPRGAVDKPPPRPCATTSLPRRSCPAENLPRRRHASRFAVRSRRWRGVRERCRWEEEATHPPKSRPTTPCRAKTRLLRPRRSAPCPPLPSCHAELPSTSSSLACRRAVPASRLALRRARPGAPASPLCRPEHPPAPGNRRGDSPGRNDERHHARCPRGAARGVPRRRGPAPSAHQHPPPPGVGACTATARAAVSAGATTSIPLPKGCPTIVTRSGGGIGRRAAAMAARPLRQLSTLGVFR